MWIRRVGSGVNAVAYSPDGRTLYTSEGSRVCAWDVAARESTRLFTSSQLAQPGYVYGLTPIGNRYLVLNVYARHLVWDIEAGKELTKIKLGGPCRAVDPNSTVVR